MPGVIETDALVVGAGPVGLFQVFQLGLQEIRAHVVDALPHAGGQCAELYADKPIYDIPALPASSGRELIDRLLQQVRPFAPQWHLTQVLSALQTRPDGRFDAETSAGIRFVAKTVFIAGGVGAFLPRPLKVDGLDAFLGTQLHYQPPSPASIAGRQLMIVGNGDAALEAAVRFAQAGPQRAASVVLVHRREDFHAAPDTIEQFQDLVSAQAIHFLAGQLTGIEAEADRLSAVQILSADGVTRSVAVDQLLSLQGLSPRLGPIADWGLALERRQLVVDTEKFQTSVPGIFAVGDVNTYPGKLKLILCGFHEATLAAFAAAPIVFPGKRIQLQYTTTSPRLHRLLGVDVKAS